MLKRIRVRGCDIAVRLDGPADSDAPWLVLSNCLAGDHRMWDAQIPWLAETHRVLRYDTRGHGASGPSPVPFVIGDLAADVVALMNHIGIPRAAFLGLSLGGVTGLELALAHPDRVTALVCADARGDTPDAIAASWDHRTVLVREAGLSAIADPTLERWLTAHTRAHRPEVVNTMRKMILATSVEGYAGCAAALKSVDVVRRLPALTVPTLYVVGAEDLATPATIMREMALATPGSRLVTVPDAAHLANIDNPDGFRDAIAAAF